MSRLARARELSYNMGMRFFSFTVALSATLCLAGCLSTEVSKSDVSGVEHIYTSDYGWKLFNCIPLFRSDITNERVQKALFEEATKRGKTAVDLAYHNYDTVLLEIPILYIPIPIPYVLCYHEIQLSGVLQ